MTILAEVMNTQDTMVPSSSHFTLAQDPIVTQDNMKSVSKEDFLEPTNTGKQPPIKPPQLALIMHKDDKHFNDNFSETLESFQYRYLAKPKLQYDHDKVGQTNFKMDRDESKFNSFQTIHKVHFPALVKCSVPGATRKVPGKNTSMSSFPSCDLLTEHLQLSDYKDKFTGHDTCLVKVPHVKGGCEGSRTVSGDKRLTTYNTSHNDIFQGSWLPKVASIPMTRVISIPQGDKEKVYTDCTTMMDSYNPYQSTENLQLKERKDTMVKMRRSNYTYTDGQDSWNDYTSVSKKHFPQKTAKVEKAKPETERNHSDLPPGDLDPQRSIGRLSNTTNNFHFGKPALGHVNPIVVGATLFTKSRLIFGEPRLSSSYYETSMREVHQPMMVPYHRVPTNRTCGLPFDYDVGEKKGATTQEDFQHPHQKRLVPNPKMMRSLTESHIHAPLGRKHLFNTTHNDTFVTKSCEREVYDRHRNQVSSVPLGTLGNQTSRQAELCR